MMASHRSTRFETLPEGIILSYSEARPARRRDRGSRAYRDQRMSLVTCNSQIDSVWLVQNGAGGVAPPRNSRGYCLVGASCPRRFVLSHTYYLFDCYRPLLRECRGPIRRAEVASPVAVAGIVRGKRCGSGLGHRASWRRRRSCNARKSMSIMSWRLRTFRDPHPFAALQRLFPGRPPLSLGRRRGRGLLLPHPDLEQRIRHGEQHRADEDADQPEGDQAADDSGEDE